MDGVTRDEDFIKETITTVMKAIQSNTTSGHNTRKSIEANSDITIIVTAVISALLPLIRATITETLEGRSTCDCKEEIIRLKSQVVESKFMLDRQEQYSRKDNIRISGVSDPHNTVEDTNNIVIKIASDMGVEIKPQDISVSHRLGKSSANYDRPVIVKFVRRDVKRKIMMNKKILKDKPQYRKVFFNDDLTRTRYIITKELRLQKKNSWTIDGKILIKDADESINIIDTYQDFCNKLKWSEGKLSELGILQ